jgi:hypothetical protein
VKISNRVYEMRTLDLTAPGGDLEARKREIVARTRAKYCVPVSVVMEDVKRRMGLQGRKDIQGGASKTVDADNTNNNQGKDRFIDLDDE